MLDFIHVWALAFLPLPLLVYWLVPRANQSEIALQVPFYAQAAQLRAEMAVIGRRSMLRRALLILVWLLLILAATQPQWIGDPVELPTTGRDLMLAVDISGSMGTLDMRYNGEKVTRLDAVKRVVGDFVERRHGDRLGLILFGSQAYLQTPLTFDRNTVRTLLEETPIGIAGNRTAIGDAIGLSVKRLEARPETSRVMILLTDGVNNVGEVSPIQGAKLAALEGVKIHTIGVGAESMTISGFLGNQTINPSLELDEDTLIRIAQLTGGVYKRARSSAELESVYAILDEIEPIEQKKETYRPVRSLYYWPLGLALLVSLLAAIFNPLVTSAFQILLAKLQSLLKPSSEPVSDQAAPDTPITGIRDGAG